eukprot:CAMPEP_0114972376 /NCGR_PEP_ID=MMETSP0216-20121206/358_1 /TAXON_ID=223996 /ORGANISM="Protocruzia adherens, Strain Boccale" /LENGTH=412 /DNA_ID=CAMNT_0002332737 /DNA_START=2190 /DNA_END=3428 /DNA_ORIENTATION=+
MENYSLWTFQTGVSGQHLSPPLIPQRRLNKELSNYQTRFLDPSYTPELSVNRQMCDKEIEWIVRPSSLMGSRPKHLIPIVDQKPTREAGFINAILNGPEKRTRFAAKDVHKAKSSLLKLELGETDFNFPMLKILCHDLALNQTIQELNFEYCGLSHRSALFASGLMDNKSVKLINLDSNEIPSADFKAWAALVKVHPCIEELNLSNNSGGNEGAVYLAQSLPCNCSLLSLQLERNGISEEGMVALASSLKHNQTLRKLNLSANIQEIEALRILIKDKRGLVSLSLNDLALSDKGVKILLKSLQGNKSILNINLDGNYASWKAAKELVYIIQNPSFCSVKQITLQRNPLSVEDRETLQDLSSERHFSVSMDTLNMAITGIYTVSQDLQAQNQLLLTPPYSPSQYGKFFSPQYD